MHNFQNLILDFGGVIYQIDPSRQIKAFNSSGLGDFDRLFFTLTSSKLLEDFETGRLSEKEFFEKISNVLGNKSFSFSDFKRLWNSILVGFDHEAIELIGKLKNRYRLFLLSNTNAIHYEFFTSEFRAIYGTELEALFEKVFWSFQTGKRKPDPESYQLVMNASGITPSSCIFVDDSLINIEGAKQVGIPSIHLTSPNRLVDIFGNEESELIYLKNLP